MDFLDLPAELILYTLKKMNVVDALCRLNGIDDRLDQYLFDSLYVRELDFTIRRWDDQISPMSDSIIDGVSTRIIPRIHEKITELTIEPRAIDRVLNAANYPNVVSLSLRHFSRKTLNQYLRGNSTLLELLHHQITHLNVEINEEMNDKTITADDHLDVFQLILSLCERVVELTFHQSLPNHQYLSIDHFSLTKAIPSTLTKLDLKLNTFDDCLSIFDGSFPSLCHCSLYILRIVSRDSTMIKKDQLRRLKSFSLISCTTTPFYDELVVPLLERMISIEELKLSLLVQRRDLTQIIDGTDLVNRIIIHLPYLQIFHFSIYNSFINYSKTLMRNDDLQRNILKKTSGQIGCYLHFKAIDTIFGYHIYSLPYAFEHMMRYSHSSSTEIFIGVRLLVINDDVPWNFQFFQKINKSFPYLESLMIVNSSGQNDKPSLDNNSAREYSRITFARLRDLDVSLADLDYIEQLLCHRYTLLPQLSRLNIKFEQLISITKNFTNDETRLNCSQIEELVIDEDVVLPEHFFSYFSCYKSLTNCSKSSD